MRAIPAMIALGAVSIAPAEAQPVWTAPPGGQPDGRVFVIGEYSGDLVIGGDFDNVGAAPVRNVARYRSSQWQVLGNGIPADFGHTADSHFFYAAAMHQDGGDLFLGGAFRDPTDGGSGIARFNGTDWFTLGGGLTGQSVNAVHGHGGKIVMGGVIFAVGPLSVGNIVAWDDNSWFTYGTGTFKGAANTAPVNAMITFETDLIIAGNFVEVSGVTARSIARWNGAGWLPMGGGLDGTVRALEQFNGELYACGNFTEAAGEPDLRDIAKWNPTLEQWEPVGVTGVTGAIASSSGFALETFNSKLYFGGGFTKIDGVSMPYVACWDGAFWSAPAPNGPNQVVRALHGRPDGLYVGGHFTLVGSLLTPYLTVLTFPCLADLNGDGILDNGDIQTFLALFLGGDLGADMNGDGILDNGDIQTFVTLFLAGC